MKQAEKMLAEIQQKEGTEMTFGSFKEIARRHKAVGTILSSEGLTTMIFKFKDGSMCGVTQIHGLMLTTLYQETKII